MRPGYAELFSHSECRGHCGTAGLRTRWPMDVVRLISVGKQPVYKRALDRTAHDIRADHRRNLLSTVRARELRCPSPNRQLRSRNHGRYCVERVFLDLLQHVIRQWAVSSLAHVSAKPRRDRAESFGCPAKIARKSCPCCNPARTSQQIAPGHHRQLSPFRQLWPAVLQETSRSDMASAGCYHKANRSIRNVSYNFRIVGNGDRDPSAGRFYPDLVIDGTANALFASEASFCGLNGNVTEQKLDLFEFASGGMTKPSTGSASRTRKPAPVLRFVATGLW
jgi:hypothetical protein